MVSVEDQTSMMKTSVTLRGLASNGFMAVHITHAGTDKAVLKSGWT